MNEHDPLSKLLREWQPPERGTDLEKRVADAFRIEFSRNHRVPVWQRCWKARISIPVPLMLAAMILFATLFWFRSRPDASMPSEPSGVVTRVDATGFEPLPNGAAQLVPVKETHQ